MKQRYNPCKPTCEKRSPTCHIDCPEYADYKVKRNEENERIHKIKEAERRIKEAEIARRKRK